MLCSEVELALGNDGSGIMILSPDAQVGQPLAETLGLKDVVFEIGLTPNRPDCLSLIGTAREIGDVVAWIFNNEMGGYRIK